MSIISWGRRESVTFTSCGNLREWAPPAVAGLYAVTYQREPAKKPKGHSVLFFGECDNFADHVNSIRHRMGEFWTREGGQQDDLFIFVHLMDGSSMPQRRRLVESLVSEYQPQANRQLVE